MKKQEFLSKLKKGLSKLPKQETEECLSFYSEMIDDRIEEGLTEEDAVAAVGDPKNIASKKLGEQISEELSQNGVGRTKKRTKKKSALEITLLILGSPVWFSLVIAAVAVAISIYASAWAVIVSFWAAFAAFAVSAPCGIIVGLALIFSSNAIPGAVLIAAALVTLSLAIFSFFGCLLLTKYVLAFSNKCALCVKNFLTTKEEV